MKTFPSFSTWFAAHRRKIDAVVFDIDGVLLTGKRPLPGAVAAIAEMKRRQFPFSLLTNDGNHSVAQKVRTLAKCGIHVPEKTVTSCSDGLVELAAKRGLRGRLFFILGELGTPCYARNAGLRTTRRPSDLPKCHGAIVGEKSYDWEPVLNAVINQFIRRPDSLLICPNPDEYYSSGPRTIELAAGAVARFIGRALGAYGIRVEPIYLGKPFAPIFLHNHLALERRLGRRLRRDRVLMIGDSLASDIQGARNFGYRSALVLTGVTTAEMLPPSPVRPDMILERL